MGLLALLLLCLINPGMGTNLMLDQIEQSQNQQLDPPTFLRPNDMNFFGEKSNLSSNSNSQVPNSLADVFISNNVPLRQKQGRYEEQSRRVMTTAPVEDAQVNMYTLSDQSSCQTAALKDGSFVVVWQSSGQDGSGLGVYARKYSASATSFNGEFQVNTNITSDQSSPSVGALLDGGFIIAWVSDGQDGDQGGIYAQRYNADGTRYGLEFRVNDVTPSHQNGPNIAGLIDGGYVITYQSYGQDGSDWGCFAKLYNADGTTRRSGFQVNTHTPNGQKTPSAASLLGGGFIITWYSQQDGFGYGIYAQIYKSDGTPQGTEFQVNTQTAGDQFYPRVTGLADGGFIICWTSNNAQDGDGYGNYGQRYNAAGVKAGIEFRINNYITGNQGNPFPASLGSDGFYIVWYSQNQVATASGNDIFIQKYDLNGNPQYANEQLVNTYTNGDQQYPVIATSSTNNCLIVWPSNGQDGNGVGVFAKLYSKSGTVIPFGDTTCSLYSGSCESSTSGVYDITTQATYTPSEQAVYNPATQQIFSLDSSPIMGYLSEKGLDISYGAASAIQNNPNTVESLGNGLERSLYDFIVLAGSFFLMCVYVLSQRRRLDSRGRCYDKQTGVFTNTLKAYANELAGLASLYWFIRPLYLFAQGSRFMLTVDYRALCDQYSQSALFVLLFFLFKNIKLHHLKRAMEFNTSSQKGILENWRILLRDALVVILVSSIQVCLPTKGQDNTFIGRCIGNTVYYVFVYLWTDQTLEWMRNKLFVDFLPLFSNTDLIHYIRNCRFYNKAESYFLTTQQLCNQIVADARYKFTVTELKLICSSTPGASDARYLLVSQDNENKSLRSHYFRTERYRDKAEIDYIITSTKSNMENTGSLSASSIFISQTPESKLLEQATRKSLNRKKRTTFSRSIHDFCFFIPICRTNDNYVEKDILLIDMKSGQHLEWQLNNTLTGSLVYSSEKQTLLLVNPVTSASSNHLTVRVYEQKNKYKQRIENDILTQSTHFVASNISKADSVIALKENVWNEAQIIERQIRHIQQEKVTIKLDISVSVDVDQELFKKQRKRHLWSFLTDCLLSLTTVIHKPNQPSRKEVHPDNVTL